MRLFEGTQFDRPPVCERCEKLESECECQPELPQPSFVAPDKQTARLQVEKRKKGKRGGQLLDLVVDDLIDREEAAADERDYPEHWVVGDLSLPLTYEFEPGSPRDGLVVNIPVASLRHLDASTFEWNVPGVRESLASRRGPTVAISPIIGGQALKGPAANMLHQLGHSASATGVAELWREVIDCLLIDDADAEHSKDIAELDIVPFITDTIMATPERRARLARATLSAASLLDR